jgi:hypothetical protein
MKRTVTKEVTHPGLYELHINSFTRSIPIRIPCVSVEYLVRKTDFVEQAAYEGADTESERLPENEPASKCGPSADSDDTGIYIHA